MTKSNVRFEASRTTTSTVSGKSGTKGSIPDHEKNWSTSVLTELIEDQLVVERAAVTSANGRRPIPGEVDPKTGVCLQSPRFGWRDLPFAELLAERVQAPVWIDDDVNAFAIAHKLFGAGRNHRNFAALAIGAGIGCSLVLNGDIYHGSNSTAGKLGHITSVPGGEPCECGRRGCLMAHAAEPYMIVEWGRRRKTVAIRADFAAAAAAGDRDARNVLSEAGTRIGRHLADLVNLFDPEIIVVGGEAVQFGELLIEPIRTAMEDYLFFSHPELQTDWVPSSWARGAAALAAQRIFDFERSPSG